LITLGLAAWPSLASGGLPVVIQDIHGTRHVGALIELTSRELRVGPLAPPERKPHEIDRENVAEPRSLPMTGKAVEKATSIPVADLLRVTMSKSPRTTVLPRAAVLLANGDLLAGEVQKIQDNSLHFKWWPNEGGVKSLPPAPASATIALPLETVRGVILRMPESYEAQVRLWRLLLDRKESDDVVSLVNGDQLTGEILGIDETSISLKRAAETTRIPRDGVLAAAYSSDLIAFPKVSGPTWQATFVDGTRLTFTTLETSPAAVDGSDSKKSGEKTLRFTGQAACGISLTFLAPSLLSLHSYGDNKIPLSSLIPTSYEFTPYLSLRWPLRKDRGVSGLPLRVTGRDYSLGWGMHSRSRVSFALDGKWSRFFTDLGIDDAGAALSRAGRGGDVSIVVEVDGVRRHEQATVNRQSGLLEIGPLDVRGAKQLVLIVDYGRGGDVLDHVSWCAPVLVK